MNDGKEQMKLTSGLDLGDRYTHLCLLDTDSSEVLEEGRVRTTHFGLTHCARWPSSEYVFNVAS